MRKYLLLLLLLVSPLTQAAGQTVYRHSVNQPLTAVYDRLYKALEEQGFYVVFEANIGKNLSNFAEKWGEDYNRSKLDGIRSLVFCNGWYANQVSNLDPNMLALCPLHLTLVEKAGVTTALFVRLSLVAAGSPAQAILQEVEENIVKVINTAMPAR